MNHEKMVKMVKGWLIKNEKTNSDLAAKIGLTPQGLSNIYAERARPNKEFLDLFGLTMKITTINGNSTVSYSKQKKGAA